MHVLHAGESAWDLVPTPVFDGGARFQADADGACWLGTYDGLYSSADLGKHWARYTTDDGIASNDINTVWVEGSGSEKTIWIGTVLGASMGTVQPQ